MKRIYVGYKSKGPYEVFKSETLPTLESHGELYGYVIGPFRTMRGARWMRDHGANNPHAINVAACEKLAKCQG
jgi:hypothetical protein